MPDFAIGADDFLLDGRPHRILSGAIHYFRVHPDQWADRIEKARLLGLNTIETYVAWNAHAPERGRFDTDGGLDLGRFLDLVAEAGMHAIVRPGPYICAEWDAGGLPGWLDLEPAALRSSDPRYLAEVTAYLDEVLAIVVPRQIDRGGPVVLVQIENEYGAFGSDRDYLRALERTTRAAGITVPLVTVDQPTDEMLSAGSLDGVHLTASFGSRSTERLKTLREHQPSGPLMCMEFWDGWFDSWGGHHHTTSVEDAARDLDDLLAAGASVNLYMFHGGTNFGLTNGANDHGTYAPLVTSYDYDAPLDESGHPSAKYTAFREVIARHTETPPGLAPSPTRTPAPCVEAALTATSALFAQPDAWGRWHELDALPTLGRLATKVALLETTLDGASAPAVLSFGEVRDRVAVFLDDAPVGVLLREHHQRSLVLPRGHGTLRLLVEDLGGVNYGPRIGEAKGLVGGARLDGADLTSWRALAVDLDQVAAGPAGADPGPAPGPTTGPTRWRAELELAEPADLFLDTSGWGRGVGWLNGFCLGRYWRRGPQHTLYVPGPVTRAGTNELVVLELELLDDPRARTLAEPDLGHTES